MRLKICEVGIEDAVITEKDLRVGGRLCSEWGEIHPQAEAANRVHRLAHLQTDEALNAT